MPSKLGRWQLRPPYPHIFVGLRTPTCWLLTINGGLGGAPQNTITVFWVSYGMQVHRFCWKPQLSKLQTAHLQSLTPQQPSPPGLQTSNALTDKDCIALQTLSFLPPGLPVDLQQSSLPSLQPSNSQACQVRNSTKPVGLQASMIAIVMIRPSLGFQKTGKLKLKLRPPSLRNSGKYKDGEI